MKKYTVNLRFKDSCTTQEYQNVISVHEEYSYTVLVLEDGEFVRFPTQYVWRMRVKPQ